MAVHRWRSTELSAGERGYAFGQGMATVVAQTVASYLEIFRRDVGLEDVQVARLGREFATRIREYRPHLAQEIEGIALGANQPSELVFAVNARTELLSGGRLAGAGAECSTVGLVDQGRRRAILGQNWDFHPALASARTCWTIEQASCSLTGLTEAGLLAKLGVNTHGLAACVNFLSSSEDTGRDGIPVHVLLRDLLEQARTLPDARDLISTAALSSSICITVAGPDGAGAYDVASFERWPGGLAVHRSHGDPPRLAHANHFLEPIRAKDVMAAGLAGDGSRSRYEQLRNELRCDATFDVNSAHRQLSSERTPPGGQAILRKVDETEPWLERCGTLATAVFEVPRGRFWLRDPLDDGSQLRLFSEVGRR